MARYGRSFLTKPRIRTGNVEWADKSRMQFAEGSCSTEWTVSILGWINGCPILSKYWRLACTVEEDGEIVGWSIISAKRCGG